MADLVEESSAVMSPGHRGELDPLEHICKRLFGSYTHHLGGGGE